MDDHTLLKQYVDTGNQAAFAQVVYRHLDMVYSTCLGCLRDPAAADDATQWVFITLAVRAGSLTERVVVAGWLYQTAVHQAAQQKRAAANRRRHEMAAAQHRSEVISAGPVRDAGEGVIQALNRLRSAERAAIILRYLEGRSLAEIAGEMRTTEEAARKRVSRGLERLRQLLRPAGASAATFGMAAVEQALAAALHPAPAAVKAAAANAATTVFSKGMVTTMAMTKTQTVATAAVLLLVLGGGTFVAVKAFRGESDQVVKLRPNHSQAGDGLGSQAPGIAAITAGVTGRANGDVNARGSASNDYPNHLILVGSHGKAMPVVLTVTKNDPRPARWAEIVRYGPGGRNVDIDKVAAKNFVTTSAHEPVWLRELPMSGSPPGSLTTYWLIDPDGKVNVSHPDTLEADKSLMDQLAASLTYFMQSPITVASKPNTGGAPGPAVTYAIVDADGKPVPLAVAVAKFDDTKPAK